MYLSSPPILVNFTEEVRGEGCILVHGAAVRRGGWSFASMQIFLDEASQSRRTVEIA
jgi:hypothetical protein